MTLIELMADYERRRVEADRHGSHAPLASVYAVVLGELRALDAAPIPKRMMTTGEAAKVLALTPKTVARRAAEGRFPGARKTSEAGRWRLPARSVYAQADGGKMKNSTSIPRLWDPGDG